MAHATTLEQLQQQVDEQVAKLLPKTPEQNCREIFLHDAVWGSIRIDAHETALLNTPLLQRLRRIRQLGSVHLIFPSAQHTRFEHSLGVIHLTSRFGDVLAKQSSSQINPEQLANLRMAALCHDLGHGPFSHYSEQFFKTLQPFSEQQDNSCDAAEQLSEMIVRSDRFRHYIKKLNDSYKCKLDPDFIAKAITGSLDDDIAYLGEIIHGPFDADKLDYLVRDGMFCGMPIRLDTDRIFTQLVITSKKNKPKRLAGRRGAVAALIQIIQHKHHMFATVYNHTVARSFNAMLSIALNLICKNKIEVAGVVIRSPADFLALDDELMLTPNAVSCAKVAGLLSDLRNRKMYKLAAWINEGDKHEDSQSNDWTKDKKEYAKKIASIAKLPDTAVAIDIFDRPNNAEARNMLMRKKDRFVSLGEIMKLDDSAIPLHNFLERHLVLCPAEHVVQVADATRKVLEPVVKDALVCADQNQ